MSSLLVLQVLPVEDGNAQGSMSGCHITMWTRCWNVEKTVKL